MKKGFTIIEIILSVGLIVLIGTISIVSFNLIKKTTKKNTLNDMFNEEIMNALRLYIETHSDVKDNLYNNKNGLAIHLSTLQNEGLIDFQNIDVTDQEDYVVAFLTTDKDCSDISTLKGWDFQDGKPLYICTNNKSENSNYLVDNNNYYIAKGENPNNWVEFDVDTDENLWAWWPNTTDSDGINEQDLWRVINIDNGSIKLVYNQVVGTDNHKNIKEYSTKYFAYESWDDPAYSLNSGYDQDKEVFNKCDVGSYSWFHYKKNTGYTGWTYSDLTATGSGTSFKKAILLNKIKKASYLKESDYFYSYNVEAYTKNFKLKLNTSSNSIIGTISMNDIDESYFNHKSWLSSLTTEDILVGVQGTITDTYLIVYSPSNQTYFRKDGCSISDVFVIEGSWRRLYEDSSYIIYIDTYPFIPVVTLSNKVKLAKNNSESCKTNALGTKACPYKLECSEC